MRMQITLDNVTTDKAIAVLSALETAELLHGAEMDVDALNLSRSGTRVEVTGVPEESEESEAEAPAEAPAKEPKRRGKYHGYRPRPIVAIPLVGATRFSRLIPLTVATQMLGWSTGRLDSLVHTHAVESFTIQHGVVSYHYLTPEQLEILRFAHRLAQAQGKTRLSRIFLKRATLLWQEQRRAA